MAEARETVDRVVESFSAHEESARRTLNAPDTEFETPGGVKLTGNEYATGYAMVCLKGYPDAKIIAENEVVSDPRVRLQYDRVDVLTQLGVIPAPAAPTSV